LRALEELNKGTIGIIGVVLKFEYLFKRVNLTKNKEKNLDVFFRKCAYRYGLNELDILQLQEILALGKKHNESGFEFSKHGNAIMLDDKTGFTKIDAEKLKEMTKTAIKLLENTKKAFKEKF
jgi:hypothetical protein